MVEGEPREDQGSSVSRADNAQLQAGLRPLLDEQPTGDSGRRARPLRIALRTETGGRLNKAVTRGPLARVTVRRLLTKQKLHNRSQNLSFFRPESSCHTVDILGLTDS